MRFAKAALALRRQLLNKEPSAHSVIIKTKNLEIAQDRASEKPTNQGRGYAWPLGG